MLVRRTGRKKHADRDTICSYGPVGKNDDADTRVNGSLGFFADPMEGRHQPLRPCRALEGDINNPAAPSAMVQRFEGRCFFVGEDRVSYPQSVTMCG